MTESFHLRRSFLEDPALDPIKLMSGPLCLPHVSQYVFYMEKGRFWASDGINHTPINPAVLSHFEPLFTATVRNNGRGALFSILSDARPCRYGVVTDNITRKYSLSDLDTALSIAAQTNFPDLDNANALPPPTEQPASPASLPVSASSGFDW